MKLELKTNKPKKKLNHTYLLEGEEFENKQAISERFLFFIFKFNHS